MMKKSLLLLLTLLLIGCSSEPAKPFDPQLASDNAAKGAAFLQHNASAEGVITLPSGLQYKVLRAGSGISPALQSNVTVHYRGTTIDGREFDSSYSRGNPMIFQTNRVIPGWTEALQLMKEGAQWQLFIPENLAYGARGAGDAIGPNETLIFEVELLKVH
ncbi:FKBP-type peptidyl-prolyl cis-trans isomerase FklB [Mariprofundus ferrinatatus]|uniref:Peptidyl-prolyl cis-trans isomerase n=1 Tax=Mariprofundus ferrinatatus TaxID=1921087 RepID=A0A2K8L5L6_9PROT|nr:FKBP-type peptidyl-prolyl cis-trans isomerase [Mariprofundus ferrinatatus]ATX82615.1 FKBP-type peptidyl-prolyl cis-trans isomerase FklB [Mariprofundus ferrinatatus]